MARLKDGILGPASGSVNNVVFSSRNGKPYIRSKPDKVSNPQTPAQQANRMKLGLLSGMLARFKPFIRVGFIDLPPGKSSRDVAYSANSKHVFTGEYPDIAIDYTRAMVSGGPLAPATDAVLSLNGQTLTFTWNPQPSTDMKFNNQDIAMVLLYHASSDTVDYSLRAAERRTGQCEMEISPEMASFPDSLHAWISFISSDGKRVSDSVHLGLE
ncbi:MAG: DUF6266 family protein [Balneolales bacterium]